MVLEPGLRQQTLDETNILFGSDQFTEVINMIIIKAKHYIYVCKYRDQLPTWLGLKAAINAEYQIEREIARGSEKKTENLNQRWEDVIDCFL